MRVAKVPTRRLAPLHQWSFHMSQIKIADRDTGRRCSKRTSCHAPLPLNASTRVLRLSRTTRPGGSLGAPRTTIENSRPVNVTRRFIALFILSSLIKTPAGFEITAQFLSRKIGSYHLNGNAVLLQDGIVERTIGHPARVDQFLVQRPKLECTQKICALIERSIVRIEGAANFGAGVVAFVPDTINQEIDAFLRCHPAQVKTQR